MSFGLELRSPAKTAKSEPDDVIRMKFAVSKACIILWFKYLSFDAL